MAVHSGCTHRLFPSVVVTQKQFPAQVGFSQSGVGQPTSVGGLTAAAPVAVTLTITGAAHVAAAPAPIPFKIRRRLIQSLRRILS
jgi:hypothetical protein